MSLRKISFLFRTLLFLLAASLFLSACDEEDTVQTRSETLAQVAENKNAQSFTLMVYICGSDLESDGGAATQDISEMLYANPGKHLNVVLQTGGAKKWQNKDIKTKKTQRFAVEKNGLRLLREMDKQDMADPNTLLDFMKWTRENYPADRYGIILWDHGGGTSMGFASDELFDEEETMDLYEMGQAFKKAGIHFDLIGFDACLMATLENAAVLAPYGDYMLASEESEPSTGWYYTNFLAALEENPAISMEALSKIVIDDYIEGEHGEAWGGMTLSLVDLSEIDKTIQALEDFAYEAKKLIRDDGYSDFSSARVTAKEYGDGDYEQIDLYDFLVQLEDMDTSALEKQLQQTVVYSRSLSSTSHGLAMYYPYYYPEEYSNIHGTIHKAGVCSENLESFYNDFVSLLVYGETSGGGTPQPHGNSSHGSSSHGSHGSNHNDDDYDDDDYDDDDGEGLFDSWIQLFDELWYDSEIEEAYHNNISYVDPEELTLTERKGDYFLELPDDQWDLITTIEQVVYLDDGEGYLELGYDNSYDFNKRGDLKIDFDGTWIHLNGHLVPFYAEEEYEDEDDEDIWYSYGYVPAELNGEKDIELMIMWDSEHEDPYVSGYSYPTTLETGLSSRHMHQLKEGDKLAFYFDYYDYDDEYDASYTLEKKPLVVGKKPIEVTYEDIDMDCEAEVYYHLVDIYQNDYWTESVIFDLGE